MPTLNLKTKQLRYAKSDEAVLSAAFTLLEAMRDYDDPVSAAADGALERVQHLLAHIHTVRSNSKGMTGHNDD